MKDLSSHLTSPLRTPPSQPIPGREAEMKVGPAGAYVFKVGDWERLDRFLLIGTEGGTYYAGEKELTVENAQVVRRCLQADMPRVLKRIIEVSDQGLAPKNDPAILALALAFTVLNQTVPLRAHALQKVCRTGTHLFQFLQAVRGLRGGGRALNGAVRAWLAARPTDQLALQMVKYRSRADWSWRDVMRRYRPKAQPGDLARCALYAWAAGKPRDVEALPSIVRNADLAQTLEVEPLAQHIRETRLPWECVPTEHTKLTGVLTALFESMPLMATVRQLSKLQAHDVLLRRRAEAIARITDEQGIAKSRIHPVAFMLAAHAYEKGEGRHLTWKPDAQIVDALDDAFHTALKTAEPTGKRILVAIDTSGSMRQDLGNHPGLKLHKVCAALALTYVRTDGADVIAFDTSSRPLPLSGRMRLTDAMRALEALKMGGGTDCSLPFKHKDPYDAIIVLTDNESWASISHPHQALQKYRKSVSPKCRAVWCAMTAGDSGLRAPDDALSFGIAGFDASAPQLVSNFISEQF